MITIPTGATGARIFQEKRLETAVVICEQEIHRGRSGSTASMS